MATRMPSLPSVRSPFRSRRHGRTHQGAGAGVSAIAALHEVVITVSACSDGQQPLPDVHKVAGLASESCARLYRARGWLRRLRDWLHSSRTWMAG